MEQTFLQILPFSLGLIISPVPIVALILLLVSEKRPIAKSTTFVLTWLVISFGTIFAVASLIQDSLGDHQNAKAWGQFGIGVLLVLIAAWVGRTALKARKRGRPRVPGWLKAVDHAGIVKIVLLTVVLIWLNPVNLSMLLAAANGIADGGLAQNEVLALDLGFTLIASVAIIIPYLLAVILGERAHNALHVLRQWLVRNNGRLTFWSTLAFGLLFVIKGIQALGWI